MKEIYRKRGAVARWEGGTLIRVSECGVAIEDGDFFECRPEAANAPDAVGGDAILETVNHIRSIAGPVEIERLIVSEGIAFHEFEEKRWSDTTRRVHISLVHGHLRALLHLGSFETGDIERLAAAMKRAKEGMRPAPPRLRVAPPVVAALLPSLAGIAPPNVALVESAGSVDGKGEPVVEMKAEPPWRYWYRPSYRMRPVRAPFDLRLECDVDEIESERPIAIALLAPPDGLTLHVLVDDGSEAYPTRVRITRIDAVSRTRTWYPYGAGAYGAELML